MRKFLILGAPVIFAAVGAMADLELTVDIEYPRNLNLKIPVEENSDFSLHTAFGAGEFFTATGHVGGVTMLESNRCVSVTYGYEYSLRNHYGFAKGEAAGSSTEAINGVYSTKIISSIWDANPGFTVREVPPPVSPYTWFTNGAVLTNFPLMNNSNETREMKIRKK